MSFDVRPQHARSPSGTKRKCVPSQCKSDAHDQLDLMSTGKLESVAEQFGIDTAISESDLGNLESAHGKSESDQENEAVVTVVKRAYCDNVKRSECGVPIDIVIFALQKEFDCVLETHGHLSSSYGTHKKQPSRSSNPAHLRAALAAAALTKVAQCRSSFFCVKT